MDWLDGVPLTNTLLWGCNHLSPVTASRAVFDIHSQKHNANERISTEPIIVHYEYLKAQFIYVSLLKIKLEGLVEDCNKSVSFDVALPSCYSPSLVNQIKFHIGICSKGIVNSDMTLYI